MAKVLKAKRRKAKPKTKIKPIIRPKAKTQKIEKKTKIEVATMRVSQSLKLPDKVKHDEPRPATQQIHAVAVEKKSDQLDPEVLPKISYKLEVDGRLKSEYPTQEAAMTVALELKRKFPQIRVAIVDTKAPKRIAVELPQAAA
jgi:type IV secretory pathway VirB10-like protein